MPQDTPAPQAEDSPAARQEDGKAEDAGTKAVASAASVIPLLDHARFWDEEKGVQTLEEAAGKKAEFAAWDPWKIRKGAVWMSFSPDDLELAEKIPGGAWLCLGTQTAGKNAVWLLQDNGEWAEVQPSGPSLWHLEQDGSQVMVRMEASPGFWFAPVLRSSASLPDMPEKLFLYGAALVLFSVALLGLLSAFPRRNDGIFWAALLALAAGVHLLFGVPAAAGLSASLFYAVFSGALALMLLPHVGRAVMHTSRFAPKTDIFFLLLAVPGAACALLPFIPGFAWTARYLVFWPLIAAFCFFPAFWLIFCGAPGSLHFASGCLILLAGEGAAVWGLMSGWNTVLALACLQTGTALGILLIACSPPFAEKEAMPYAPLSLDDEDDKEDVPENDRIALLNSGLEKLLDESCRLDQALSNAGMGDEKADVMEHADGMISAVRDMASQLRGDAGHAALPDAPDCVFELRTVIRNVLNSIHSEVEKRKIGLAWYVSPCIRAKFRGNEAQLTNLLTLLMADSVRASSGGSVMLHVTRPPESTSPGHLKFTIKDSGDGRPPLRRHSALLARAWDFASDGGGSLDVRSTAQGTEISFSLKFGDAVRNTEPAHEQDGAKRGGMILLAAKDGQKRHVLAWQLEGLGHLAIREAESMAAVVDAVREQHPEVIVLLGDLDEEEMRSGYQSVRSLEKERSWPVSRFLLLGKDPEQASRLKVFEHLLLYPSPRKDVRRMVRWLLSPGDSARPVLSTERITVADVLAGVKSGGVGMNIKTGVPLEKPEPSTPDPPEQDGAAGSGDGRLQMTENDDRSRAQENADLLSLGGEQNEKKGGWLDSMFGTSPSGGTLSIDIGDGSPDGERQGAGGGSQADNEEPPVLGREDQVVELTEDDIVPVREEDHAPQQDGAAVGEDLEDPQLLLLEGARSLGAALRSGRRKDAAQISLKLARLAETYDLRTISDMAHCVCAACGEGDMASAEQSCEELLSELERK